MQTLKTELSDVIYNAAEQTFEAKVTVHEGAEQYTYPCSMPGAIDVSFEDAAKGLTDQALRRHGKPTLLRSVLSHAALPKLRVIKRPKLRRGLPIGQYGFFRGHAA